MVSDLWFAARGMLAFGLYGVQRLCCASGRTYQDSMRGQDLMPSKIDAYCCTEIDGYRREKAQRLGRALVYVGRRLIRLMMTSLL